MIHELEDTDLDQQRTLQLSMFGKTQDHTIIDDLGNITKDSAVLISMVTIDDIDVTDIFCMGPRCYSHNNNEHGSDFILDEFYGYIGQNGIVTWQFELPIYKWFLKHC